MDRTHFDVRCCFCSEISSRLFPVELQQVYGERASRICHETRDFVVFPSVSPLTAGHLLVVSQRHVHSFADLPLASRQEAQALVEGLGRHLAAAFAQPAYIFEHGVPVHGGNACGVDHAHVHVLPLPGDIASEVQARVNEDFPASAHGPLLEVLELVSAERNESYLIYGDSSSELAVCAGRDIRSQYMREIIAGLMGSRRYDWKGLYNADAFALSYKVGAGYGHA